MIAYVDSPFQMLQLYELSKRYGDITKIYIRLNGKVENDKQLKNTAKLLGIRQCSFIKVTRLHHKLYYYSLILVASFFCNRFIVGDANSFLFDILRHFLPNHKILLLDDGIATINDTEVNKTYQRFTIFQGFVANSITNDFSYLKKLINVKNPVKKHIIVGAKFIDEGICNEVTYDKALAALLGNYNNISEPCVYIAHRGESEFQLERLRSKFKIEIIRLEYPVELLSLETGISPISISHILSTAVFSMRIIYTDVDMITYRVSSNELLSRKEKICSLYNQIDQQGFSVLIS